MSNGKTLLLGFPGSGLIGTFTVSYLISHLKMHLVGEISHPEMPPTIFVENGEIFGPIRIYKKDNLYAIISDIPIYPDIAYEFVSSLAEFCKNEKIGVVIAPSGVDAENVNKKESKTHGLVTDESLDKMLYDNDIPKFLAGSIVGTDAAVITTLRNMRVPLLMLYTSCHPYFPDPQASLYAITSLSKILKIQVDTSDIQKRIDYLRIQHRNLMQETLEALHQQEKQAQTKAPPIYR
jgi:uncharacterized protein